MICKENTSSDDCRAGFSRYTDRVHRESPSTEPGVVLVVDDEAAVRLFCCTVLRRSGFQVLEAAGPAEALDTLQQEAVGLVLTDITMPGMNGREMVKRIDREQQPDLRVLYMSGYSQNLEPGMDFLEKPFTSADLVRRVRSALDPESHRNDGTRILP
jgi:two-component system, cell cycle sensor histidine kinase and response regulator CckA